MRQRFIRTQLSALVVGLVLAVNASADDSRFVVKDIRLEGLMRVSPANIYAQLPLSNGDTVDNDKVASAIRALFKSGNFEDVTSERDGDVLIFKVTERPAIASIKISGNKVIDTDTLTKALKDAGLVEGEVLKRATLDHIKSELERQYFGQGRYDASIVVTNDAKPRNRVAVDIKINEGDSAKIQAINIVGNNA